MSSRTSSPNNGVFANEEESIYGHKADSPSGYRELRTQSGKRAESLHRNIFVAESLLASKFALAVIARLGSKHRRNRHGGTSGGRLDQRWM